MKRISLIVLSVLLVLFSVINVNAANEVSFIATDVECNNNRLFTVDIKAQSADLFSVATFEFNYDRTKIEFREASCDRNSYVRAYDNGNTLVVSYLCKDGINVENYTTIFTLKFKSLSTGTTNLNYSVSNCVNSFVEDMPIGSCTSSLITVNTKSSNKDKENSKNDVKDNNSKNSSKNQNYYTYENSGSTTDQLGFLNDNSFDNTAKIFIVGCLSGAAFIAVVVSVFFIGRNSAKSGKKDINTDTIDTEEKLS